MNDRRPPTGPGVPAPSHPVILSTTVRRLRAPYGPGHLRCRLRYTAQDPYAVTLDFLVDTVTGQCVTWVVARDLLDDGTREPSGEGDFRVWPLPPCDGAAERVRFSLNRPDGHVAFEAEAAAVRQWLDATYALVPPGTEHRLLDWDALEAALLGRD
ncbi:SsgA family sporulation/cell division regulator [Streptomyces flaveolus]|uniref:SsgA family sporulation/cell division regulator n=1 Tax=Streptomyces flaveolus TaxID=67297 RepID=UPI0033B9BB4E